MVPNLNAPAVAPVSVSPVSPVSPEQLEGSPVVSKRVAEAQAMRAEMAAAAMEVAAEDADAALKAAITREAVTKVVVPEFEFVDSDEDVDAMEEGTPTSPCRRFCRSFDDIFAYQSAVV